MGSYLVGFDNMAYYVPTTLLWLRGEVTLGSFIATAPLLYTLTTSLSVLSGSVFIALKILPPVLLGVLGLSIYTYARRGLTWSPIKSLIPTLTGHTILCISADFMGCPPRRTSNNLSVSSLNSSRAGYCKQSIKKILHCAGFDIERRCAL